MARDGELISFQYLYHRIRKTNSSRYILGQFKVLKSANIEPHKNPLSNEGVFFLPCTTAKI
ncbi:MAG: hypothetical protein QG626_87 [Patescibacteria group bacterium]|jgi:hypothetical protein|nr:hypothetical protein [Patescibacteria group bacterium]